MFVASEMKSHGNTYLLQEAVNSRQEVEFTVGEPLTTILVVLLNSPNGNHLCALFSNGKLYEYNFDTKELMACENADQICYIAVL